MGKHTPGPWMIQSATRNYDNFKIEAEGWGIITNIEDNSNESESNARLIAAAPEMLEALKDLLSEFDARNEEFIDIRVGYFKDTAGIAYTRTIIAKAEGR